MEVIRLARELGLVSFGKLSIDGGKDTAGGLLQGLGLGVRHRLAGV